MGAMASNTSICEPPLGSLIRREGAVSWVCRPDEVQLGVSLHPDKERLCGELSALPPSSASCTAESTAPALLSSTDCAAARAQPMLL